MRKSNFKSCCFIFRLWSSGCRSRYQGGLGRLKFLQRPFCIVGKLLILRVALGRCSHWSINKFLFYFRCDNYSCIIGCVVRWCKRSSNGGFRFKRTQVFPNSPYGTNGSSRRDLEIIRISSLCSSTGKPPQKP